MTTPSPGTALKLRVFPAPPVTVTGVSPISVSKVGNVYSVSVPGGIFSSASLDAAFGAVPGTYIRRDTAIWTGSSIVGDDLPNPSVTTKGGVKASNLATGNIVGSIDTTGTPQAAQRAVITGATLTGSQADTLADLSQTWNTSGAPTALKITVTNTASSGASRLLTLNAGATGTTEIFSVLAVAAAPTFTLGARAFGQASPGGPNTMFSGGALLGLQFTNAAQSAVIGLLSDTGVFSFSGTTSGTHTVAAPAVASGASTLPTTSGVLHNSGMGYPLVVFGASVNFNAVGDYPITITLPPGITRYRIQGFMIINTGTTASLTTAQYGVFSGAGGTGTALVAGGTSLAGITSNAANTNASMLISAAAQVAYFNFSTLQFRVTTAQGASANGFAYVQVQPLP